MSSSYNIIQRAGQYFRYRLKSVNAHGLHSPFVYELAQDLLYDKTRFYAFQKIDDFRLNLQTDTRIVQRKDFGRGGKVYPQSVSEIVRNQSVSKKYGELLFKLVNKFQPSTIVELGTSLGVSTSYLALAQSQSQVFSFEGDPELFKLAQENLEQMGIENVNLVEGNFDKSLKDFLNDEPPPIDFIYLDGNHQLKPSRAYLEMLLPHTHEETVWVFDDIHWSANMEKFWEEIKLNSSFNVCIDIFQMGLAFPQPGQRKENFIVRY